MKDGDNRKKIPKATPERLKERKRQKRKVRISQKSCNSMLNPYKTYERGR